MTSRRSLAHDRRFSGSVLTPGGMSRWCSLYPWVVLANVTVVNFVIVGIAWYYVTMLVSPLIADLGTDLSGWGLLWGAISLGAFGACLPAGALADRLGVRSVVGAGLFLGLFKGVEFFCLGCALHFQRGF